MARSCGKAKGGWQPSWGTFCCVNTAAAILAHQPTQKACRCQCTSGPNRTGEDTDPSLFRRNPNWLQNQSHLWDKHQIQENYAPTACGPCCTLPTSRPTQALGAEPYTQPCQALRPLPASTLKEAWASLGSAARNWACQ